MALLVVKGKVLVGNSGGEVGVCGWLKALDANDGKTLWIAYSSGSDDEYLVGQPYKPFYDAEKGQNLGVTTWPADHWKLGGGTVWGWISYDAQLNLIYYGTANPGCWNPTDVRRRQQVVVRRVRARRRHRAGGLILPVQPARSLGPR